MNRHNRHTATIAIKLVTTVNKTSQRVLPPLSGEVSDTDELVSRSSVDRVEMMRLSLSFAFFFALDALGVELIVVEANEEARECVACKMQYVKTK